jgi:hypothetical protein
MNKNFLLFIVCLVALLVFQVKAVMPLIYDIVASDFFLEDSGDEENRISTTNALTINAFDQCNNHITKLLSPENSVSFSEKAINSFSLGNFQYVINADVEITPENATPLNRRYVCRIKYLEGADSSANLSISENWSVDGLSGLDNL